MAFFHPVPGNPYCWNRVIPGVLTDAMTYDEMIAHAMWKMDKIVNYLVHSVPYLIDVELNANSDSCTLTGFLYDDYQKKEFNHTFTAGGSADGTYYVNYRTAGPDVHPISETTDPIFVSQEYMPMNCTTLYSFTITDGKIDPSSVQFNDLYTGMHNADPDAHKALFDAVYAKIDAEIAEVNEALAAETAARQAADTQLQNNIDAETTARKQADTQLQNNIDAESTARQQADTTLQNNIDAESTARQQADTNLQSQITANDNDIGALTTRVTTAESDITALEGQMGTAETNITGLQTRMGAAETKIANNASAISNESATRQSEDEALATQISTETQQRKQQDSQLNTSISANTQAIAALNAGTGTVKTVNTLTGNVTLAAGNNVTITPSGNTLTIAATGGGGTAGVSSVNNVTGAVNLVAGSNVSITPSGQNITIASTGGGSAGVASVNGITGPVTISAGSGAGIDVNASGSRITIDNTGVTQINGVTGNATIVGTGGIEVNAGTSDITLQTTPGAFTKSVTAATASGGSPVTITPNTSDGAIAMTSGDGSITFGNYNSTNKLDVKVASNIAANYQNYVGFTGKGVPYTSVEHIPEVTVSHSVGQFTITLPQGVTGLFKNSSTSFTNLDTIKYCAVPDTAFTTSGMYIVYITPGTTTTTARLASTPGDPGQIPLIALWVAINAEGDIVDWTWDGIAVKKKPAAPPPETFYVTLNMLDDYGEPKTVSAPAFKVSDKMLILGNWSYAGATLDNTFATINLSVLGYRTMPTRSMGGVITTYSNMNTLSLGQAGFGGIISSCTLTVSGTLSNSTWVMAPFYFIWD